MKLLALLRDAYSCAKRVGSSLGWLGVVVFALFGALMFAPSCAVPEDMRDIEHAKAERDTALNELHDARSLGPMDDAEFARRVAAIEEKFAASLREVEERIAARSRESADTASKLLDPTSLGREAVLIALATWLHGKRRDHTRKRALNSLAK